MENLCYVNYPWWIVLLSNLVSLSIYIIGAYIFLNLGLIFTILYLLYCFILEIRLLKEGCVNCYYYGKVCGFGKGKLSALFFKRGDPSRFSQHEISWKDMIPDMMVFIFPIIGGTVLLIYDFSWITLFLMVVLVILSLAGNALVRGLLTCSRCKQRELGCPAEKLFQEK
ncbi:MAG: hypothetical protein A4E27_00776 [Methanobacterium sp. PtaU1.Bin242]|nr:MAG: hypothetical protein A4E27_00776 [Methanobacterium sp. PtaU1.Bin242]